ncbi:KxDL motif-containing protein 1 [Nymphaea thermarum]|nr:KxDL motif-containing protein 1 [Nymphaea thermarum]
MEKSERESIEAASKEICRQFKSLINTEDVETLKNLQILILGRLQDSNAVLSHFNQYSEQCFTEIASDFSRNTRLLKSMKSDLDHIFQKLRSMKAKILKHYPDAFQEAPASKIVDDRPDLEIALSGKATL